MAYAILGDRRHRLPGLGPPHVRGRAVDLRQRWCSRFSELRRRGALRRSRSSTGPPRSTRARSRFDAPMLYALGFIGLFTIGGLTGLFLAALAIDVHVHRHLFRRRAFPLHHGRAARSRPSSAGCISGGRRSPAGCIRGSGARFAAVLIFFGFNLTFFPQFILGYLGMPRRYHVYPPEFQVLHVLSSAGASILAIGYLVPFVYLFYSLRMAGPLDRTHGARPASNGPCPRRRRSTISRTSRSGARALRLSDQGPGQPWLSPCRPRALRRAGATA